MLKNFLKNAYRILVAPIDWMIFSFNWNDYGRDSEVYLFPLNPSSEDLKSLGISSLTLKDLRRRMARAGFRKMSFNHFISWQKVRTEFSEILGAFALIFLGVLAPTLLLGGILGLMNDFPGQLFGFTLLTTLLLLAGLSIREHYLARLFGLARVSDEKVNFNKIAAVNCGVKEIRGRLGFLPKIERLSLRKNLDETLYLMSYSLETNDKDGVASSMKSIWALRDLVNNHYDKIKKERLEKKLARQPKIVSPKALASKTIEPADEPIYLDYGKDENRWELHSSFQVK